VQDEQLESKPSCPSTVLSKATLNTPAVFQTTWSPERQDGGDRALVSPDGVAPSRMVSVSASVNLPLHHKVQTFSSGTSSPGWSQKRP